MSGGKRSRTAQGAALIVGTVLLILGLAPYGFGLQAQRLFTTLVDQLTQVWLVPIVATRYQRGWFSSTADMFLAVSPGISEAWQALFPPPLPPHETPSGLRIHHEVRHGPFPFVPQHAGVRRFLPVQALLTTTVRPGSPEAQMASPPSSTATPTLHVHTTVFLRGASQSHILLPAFVTPSGEHPALVWDGLRGEVNLAQQGHHLLGALRAPGLQWQQAHTQVRLRNAMVRLDALSGPEQGLHGQLFASVDALDIAYTTDDQAAWGLQDGEVRGTMAMGGASLHTEVDLRCSTCRLARMLYHQGRAHLVARRLHLPTLQQIGQEIAILWPDESNVTTLWLRLLFSGALAHWLADLAHTSPTLDVNHVHLQTPEGDIHVTAHLALDGTRVVSPGHLSHLLHTIEANATVEAPASWVQTMAVAQAVHLIRERSAFGALLSPRLLRTMAAMAVEKYLRNLVEKAYLTQEGTMYKSKARYADGQLWVNDKPVELPPLAP